MGDSAQKCWRIEPGCSNVPDPDRRWKIAAERTGACQSALCEVYDPRPLKVMQEHTSTRPSTIVAHGCRAAVEEITDWLTGAGPDRR